ncbi:MAG TPA: exodeoxyribonuclease V subunit gamma [Desulfobacterales bacterium]|nr:exodeoxyribonuclease V subunit gamma [Desulfobacterales bacterium]
MAGLHIFTSNRMEVLIEQLADRVCEPPASPLAPEIIVVQSRGMERYITMELARRNGICANVEFPFPNAFLERIFRTLSDTPDGQSAFDPHVLAFRIMAILPGFLDRPDFAELRTYLAEDRHQLKLFQLSGKLAGLFDQYAVFRPDMLLGWEQGSVAPDRTHRWQSQLWRTLAGETPAPHRTRVKDLLLHAMRRGLDDRHRLPERVSMFGISYLPPFYLNAFAELAPVIRVHLFLLNPCREYWAEIASPREMHAIERRYSEAGVAGPELHLEPGHRLLSSLGALGRDFFEMIAGFGAPQEDRFEEPAGDTVLARLQADILNLQAPAPGAASPADDSIRIHSCHSPMREIEVLRDQLLDMFAQDPGLRPQDIVVMAPDIAAYAPYISAVFGSETEERLRIPFSIADRGPIGAHRLETGFFALLDLKGSRFGASEILGLLEFPGVKEKAGLSETDLPLIERWVRHANIRWGEDAHSLQTLGLPGQAHNTWKAGIERLLLGYAMPSRGADVFNGILAVDAMEGGETHALGNFLDFLARTFELARNLERRQSLGGWRSLLKAALNGFFQSDETTEPEFQKIERLLDELAGFEDSAGFGSHVGIEVVEAFLADRAESARIGHGFLTGGVTFCAMLPMRTIPFKVVCLVGMNHDAFPREHRVLPFDLMARTPRRGDRSRRNDDKYLFLESILSARRRLYISYVGQGIQDNSRRPPSVLVSELIDTLAPGGVLPEGATPAGLVTEHRLQSFSRAYFQCDAALFSYSREDLAACSGGSPRGVPDPFFRRALPLGAEDAERWRAVTVEALSAFFAGPARFLVQNRLGIRLEKEAALIDESEPFALDSLSAYRLGQTMLQHRLAGSDPMELLEVFRAAGDLPHGRVGDYLFTRLSADVDAFASRVKELLPPGATEPVDVAHEIGGFHVTGRLTGLSVQGCVRMRYAGIKAKDFLTLWLQHLLLCLAAPGVPERCSLLIGKGQAWAFGPLAGAAPILETLLDVYRRGLLEPLPFFPESSRAFFEKIAEQANAEPQALAAARRHWFGSDYAPGECDNPYHRLCFGDSDPLADDFKRLAVAVFQPLFEHVREISG